MRVHVGDLVALRLAVELCGGRQALRTGRHMRIRELEAACDRLRQAGVERPLIQVELRRAGSSVVASVDGVVFRPFDGQLVIREVADGLGELVDDLARGGPPGEVRQIRRKAGKLEHSLIGRTASRQPRTVPGGAVLSLPTEAREDAQ